MRVTFGSMNSRALSLPTTHLRETFFQTFFGGGELPGRMYATSGVHGLFQVSGMWVASFRPCRAHLMSGSINVTPKFLNFRSRRDFTQAITSAMSRMMHWMCDRTRRTESCQAALNPPEYFFLERVEDILFDVAD